MMDKVSKDNSGFSILEVLIAVVILAIIIVPMLHSFVSSHRMNVKSKQLMRATTLAQNEMEIFEKEKIETLMDPAKFDYTVTGPETDGSYVFARNSISNDESGASASRFDVVVRLNPERADDTGRYFDTNTKDLLYVNTVGGLDSGSFVQPVKNAANLNGFDENVYQWFYNNKLPSGDSVQNLEKGILSKGLARKITVRVYQVTEGAKTNTIVKVIYDYFAPDGVMSNGCQRYTDEEIVFNNAQKKDEDGNPVELQNVFLFFAPRYDAEKLPGKGDMITYGGRNYKVAEDLIVIENEAALPVNFFVVRQELEKTESSQPSLTPKGKTTEIRAVPTSYQPKIEIHDGQNAEGGMCGTYYTNLNLGSDVKAADTIDPANQKQGTGKPVLLSIYDSNTGAPLSGGDLGVGYSAIGEQFKKSIRSLTGDDAMESKDRIYTMEVKVYTHADAHEDDEKPIVTLTGTKLE